MNRRPSNPAPYAESAVYIRDIHAELAAHTYNNTYRVFPYRTRKSLDWAAVHYGFQDTARTKGGNGHAVTRLCFAARRRRGAARQGRPAARSGSRQGAKPHA